MIDFSDFFVLRQEIGLMAVFLFLLVYDIFASGRAREQLYLISCVLFGLHTLAGFIPAAPGTAFGGLYVSSAMTVLMKNILNMGTLLVFMQSYKWLRGSFKQGEFYVITLATLLGMYLMVSAGNFMMLYIGIETASLPMAALAAFEKYREKSAEAGAKYILMTALSSGIMMFGLSYLYGATGTMYFADMQPLIAVHDPLAVLGFVFFFAGLAFKISIVPFHLWTADVYEGAPTSVTAYLSVVSKGAAVFALIFSLWQVFGNIAAIWHHILWGLSVLTIVTGNLFAIRQKDIKRFFAFSSVSQAGFILLGVMGGAAEGMTATVYFVLVYLFSNLAAFGVISAVEGVSERTDIAACKGLYRTNPRLAFVMMLAVFSLAGIPPFAGFFSKFFIFAAAAREGEYLLVFIALLNTVISLYYYLLIVKVMFIDNPEEAAIGTIRTDGYNRLSLVLCTAGILVTGILSGIYEYIGGISFGM
jgi:NADH-quinone oxidoreductase subunit N